MKKNMISVVVIIILLSVVASVMAEAVRDETKETQTVRALVVVSTQTTQKTPVDQRNKLLSQKAEEINKNLCAMAKDGAITKEEASGLIDLIQCFQKMRNEALAIYGENQIVKIDPKIEEIARLYTYLILKDGSIFQPEIKRIIAELTKQDILQIEESFNWGIFQTLITMILILVLLLFAGIQLRSMPAITAVITMIITVIAIIFLGFLSVF